MPEISIYPLILDIRVEEQLEFHLTQQNLTWYGSVMKQNNSTGVLLKRYQYDLTNQNQSFVPFLQLMLSWDHAVSQAGGVASVWQWHVCDTSRPEYEAAVPSVTCHVSRDALDLTPTPGLETPALHPAVDIQINHQSYGLSWLQHCSNEAGACNSAVLPTFILKYIKVKHVL